jgi:hypothetical protein
MSDWTITLLVVIYQFFEERAVSVFRVRKNYSTLKIMVSGPSKSFVFLNQTARGHIPHGHKVNSHCRETLKSRRLQVLQEMVLGRLRVFGLKRHEVTGDWRNCLTKSSVVFRLNLFG